MRLLKYIPQIACAAILLLATFATPAFAQVINSALTLGAVACPPTQPPTPPPMVVGCFVSATNGPAGPIDYGSTGYYRTIVSVPAGFANANNVVLHGVFTPSGMTTPAARLNGFSAAAFGAGCVIPDPDVMPTNMNTFKCSLGTLDDGAAPVERRPRISQPAPSAIPASCPAVASPGTMMVTASALNAAPVSFTNSSVETEDFTDLSVAVSGPEGANVGDTVTYTTTITNFGPCPAERVCATNINSAVELNLQSNSGDCMQLFGSCNTASARYNPATQCGFAQSLAPRQPPDNTPGYLAPRSSFRITSTYKIDPLPRSVTSVAENHEIDIVSDTNLINYADHTQSSTVNTIVQSDTSCSVARTGSSSIAVVGLVVLVAYALNRRKRS